MMVYTASMGDAVPQGSLIVVGPRTGNTIAVGEILVVDVPGGRVPHRVVEIEPSPRGNTVAITKGDQNLVADGGLRPLDGEQLVVRWVMTTTGRLLTNVVNPIAAASLAIVTMAMMIWALRRLWNGKSSGSSHAPQRTRRPSIGAKGAVAVVAANGLLSAGVASALFTGSDSVINNQFGTSCFDASVAAVQTGQMVNTIEGTQSVAISAVDVGRSLLLTSVASDNPEPADSMILGRLNSATEVQLIRKTDASGPENITVQWTVIEYGCGVSVQRGDVFGNGAGTQDVTISAVDQASSFVITSSAPDRLDAAYDGDDGHLAYLDDPTTLRLAAAAGATLPVDHEYSWQVVTFDDAADIAVQTATQTLSSTDSETITLGSAVDPATTMVLAHATSAGSGADLGERMARVHLSSPTTVEVTRLLGGDSLEVTVQVITFAEGTSVQHGVVNLGIGQASAAVAVNPVDSTTASAISTVSSPGSLSGGATTMNAAAVVGEGSATFEVTDPVTVTITRSATVATASFAWQLIEWGGPGWWDSGYPFRQRIAVATSSVAAPDGYTVPVTLDHASLASGGFANTDGSDLRVLRWDGSTWTELDRVLDDNSAWNAADTTLWFKTSSAIDPASSDSYWLYFGDDTPATPLDDPEQVWLLDENFDSASLGDFEDRTGATAWYQAEPWTERIPLTIQSSQVDADLTSFPVLVQLSDAGLGAGAQSDGDDIRFTAADGSTELNHEIEAWDPGTGTLTAWVSVPSVAASIDTTIYLYYGAADAPQQQQTTDVWPDVDGVWHLSRDPAGPAPQLDDTSPQRRDGLSSGSMSGADLVSGLTGSAIDFDGIDDRLDAEPFDIGSFSSGSSTTANRNALTVSAWVNLDSAVGDQLVVGKANDAASRVFALSATGTAARLQLGIGGSGYTVSGGSLSPGTWYHLAGTWDGATMTVYVDGVAVDSAAVSGVLDRDQTMPVAIGDLASNEQPLDGRIDEVRVEPLRRTNAWLTASVRNQSAPGTFVVAGATEAGSWFGQGTWTYRKPLAVDAAMVGATLTDQPVLVDFSDPELVGKLQTDGDDVIFTAADGVTRLDHQLEAVNSASGSITAWVRVPSVDASQNTEFFMYYGNASAVSQQAAEQVFGPDADLVFHGS